MSPGSVKHVRKFVYFCGILSSIHSKLRRTIGTSLVALTRKRAVFAWTAERQEAFMKLKSCLFQAPILGFPTENDRFVLDTDSSLFAVICVLNQLQEGRDVVIAYASRSLRLSQRRYYTTWREMLAAVTMCNHFRSDHRSLRFWNLRYWNLQFGNLSIDSDGRL